MFAEESGLYFIFYLFTSLGSSTSKEISVRPEQVRRDEEPGESEEYPWPFGLVVPEEVDARLQEDGSRLTSRAWKMMLFRIVALRSNY